jgi:hypothetical protein
VMNKKTFIKKIPTYLYDHLFTDMIFWQSGMKVVPLEANQIPCAITNNKMSDERTCDTAVRIAPPIHFFTKRGTVLDLINTNFLLRWFCTECDINTTARATSLQFSISKEYATDQ